jgi:hypothetical protein
MIAEPLLQPHPKFVSHMICLRHILEKPRDLGNPVEIL